MIGQLALWRTGRVQRAANSEIFALMVQEVNLVTVEIVTARLVAHEGVVVPAIPQAAHNVREIRARGRAGRLNLQGRSGRNSQPLHESVLVTRFQPMRPLLMWSIDASRRARL